MYEYKNRRARNGASQSVSAISKATHLFGFGEEKRKDRMFIRSCHTADVL